MKDLISLKYELYAFIDAFKNIKYGPFEAIDVEDFVKKVKETEESIERITKSKDSENLFKIAYHITAQGHKCWLVKVDKATGEIIELGFGSPTERKAEAVKLNTRIWDFYEGWGRDNKKEHILQEIYAVLKKYEREIRRN